MDEFNTASSLTRVDSLEGTRNYCLTLELFQDQEELEPAALTLFRAQFSSMCACVPRTSIIKMSIKYFDLAIKPGQNPGALFILAKFCDMKHALSLGVTVLFRACLVYQV